MFQLPEPQQSARRAGMRRVLVIDDEPTLRLGYAYALANPETSVATAATGSEGLQQIADYNFDIIILDLRMPEMDGIGVIEALRGAEATVPCRADIPIVLCSGLSQPHATLRAIRHGVVDFLIKPMRPVDLREAVEFVLNPEDDPLSLALQEVRLRRLGMAITALEHQTPMEKRAMQWLDVLKSIRDVPNGGDSSCLAETVRAYFQRLAFNSPPQAG